MSDATLESIRKKHEALSDLLRAREDLKRWRSEKYKQRFELAKAAMQGMLPLADRDERTAKTIAKWAVEYADALLQALEES